jgi:ankyrin repeat protein
MMTKYFRYLVHLLVVINISTAHAGAYEDFFVAVARDDGRTVSQLLQRGFDPNARNPDGQTALHLALRGPSPNVAEALWRHAELDIDATNQSGETPLMFAALRGQLDWARRLLERGAKLQRTGWSPLHYAATGPEPAIVGLLLDRGAPIDAPSPNRTTPLMMAARYGAEASVDLLLARGADKRLRNDRDLDAAGFARLAGREYLIKRLEAP